MAVRFIFLVSFNFCLVAMLLLSVIFHTDKRKAPLEVIKWELNVELKCHPLKAGTFREMCLSLATNSQYWRWGGSSKHCLQAALRQNYSLLPNCTSLKFNWSYLTSTGHIKLFPSSALLRDTQLSLFQHCHLAARWLHRKTNTCCQILAVLVNKGL